MAHLYYREDLEAAEFIPDNLLTVRGEEARHAVRVSRLRVGEHILVGNGAGALGEGVVTEVDREHFVVRLERAQSEAQTDACTTVLVQALAKGDRDERAVEQATEFGVDRIVPWQSERSISRWDGAKEERGTAKWQRVAREAAKQSLRARIPVVARPTSLAELCELAGADGTALLVLHPRGTRRLSDWARDALTHDVRRIVVVVGPEGGFSDAELGALQASGAEAVRLGEAVLRTSSAGPAALALINAALGRW